MERVIERCCGLNVHKKTVVACVRVPGGTGGGSDQGRGDVPGRSGEGVVRRALIRPSRFQTV